MSRITINELSGSLKEYLNGLGLTEAQVQELIDKSEDKKIGDMSQLSTDSKDLVGAINELFQSANNGKQLIANAIGEPLNSNDTFSAMSDKIINLLYKFRTNMANSGVVVEGGDNFEQLIDKITIMSEEGKGIRYNAGAYSLGEVRTFDEFYGGKWDVCDYQSINIPKAFDMNFIYVYTEYNYPIIDPDSGRTYDVYAMDCIMYDPLLQTLDDGTPFVFAHNIYDVYDAETGEYHNWGNWSTYVKLIDDTDHVSLPLIGSYYMEPNALSYDNITFNSYYAVGFGEEDATLRNSLASILQEEDVDVTEEDGMASLIVKVDEEFTEKNNELSSLNTNITLLTNQVNNLTNELAGKVTPAGNAVAGDVLSGKTFINSTGQVVTGNIVNRGGAQTVTPGTSNKTLNAGYYSGNITIAGDADLVAANIVSGKNIFGVAGTAKKAPTATTGTAYTLFGPIDRYTTTPHTTLQKVYTAPKSIPVSGTYTCNFGLSYNGYYSTTTRCQIRKSTGTVVLDVSTAPSYAFTFSETLSLTAGDVLEFWLQAESYNSTSYIGSLTLSCTLNW